MFNIKGVSLSLSLSLSLSRSLVRVCVSGNAWYYLVWKQLSHKRLSKNLNIKIYRTIILPVVNGCESWSLTLKVARRMRVLRRIFGPKRDTVMGVEETKQ